MSNGKKKTLKLSLIILCFCVWHTSSLPEVLQCENGLRLPSGGEDQGVGLSMLDCSPNRGPQMGEQGEYHLKLGSGRLAPSEGPAFSTEHLHVQRSISFVKTVGSREATYSLHLAFD